MTVGQIAAAAEVSAQTVRYYERRGLLPMPPRSASGYREYEQGHLRRLRFIRRAQMLGFSLDEIQELLKLRVRNASTCASVERRTRDKITVVDGKLTELQRLRDTLEGLAQSCRVRRPTSECPVLESLDDAPPE